MPGVLWNVDGEREAVEASGVYRGVVKEDMIDTVRRVKRPFIDVFIEELFFEDADYPLTYVPMVNMVLPLKEGQEVWVYFNQQNHRYPVFWKLAGKFEDSTDFVKPEAFEPSLTGELVNWPGPEVTKEVFKISDDMWVIATDSYCVMHYGSSCVLMNAGGVFTNSSGMNMIANTFNLDVLEKLDAKVRELELELGEDSAIRVKASLVIEAASNILEFTQSMMSFNGGLLKCGGTVSPGSGPFLNSAAQNCFYCGASQGGDTVSVGG
jgi:hypothetical protein